MKKIIVLILSVFCFVLASTDNVYARDCLKHFYAYEVKNVNIREFSIAARKAVLDYDGPDKTVPLKGVPNAYIYTSPDCTYFVKLYPANRNTNIFVVANEEYNVNENELVDFLESNGYDYAGLKDKDALKEYKFDFYMLARQQKLGNFYISPDLVKPLKVGMSKLNEKLDKHSKKTSVIPYSIDSSPIELTLIDTTGYYDNDTKIAFAQREYRLKEKSNKYVHAYEYILLNNSDFTATITATSERLAGLKDVTTEAFVDLDRLDLLDTVGSFPPVLICTAGLSVLCSVPNWVRLAKITKEASRFAHALPEKYQLRPQGKMRILVLKYKLNPKPVRFDIQMNNQNYKVVF